MKTLEKANESTNSRFEKSLLKEKQLNQIKDLRDKAIVARDTKAEIRLNAEYEKLLTSSCIEDVKANDKTPVTSRGPSKSTPPAKKQDEDKKDDKKHKYIDNPDNEEDLARSFHTRLADLIHLNKQTKP